MISCTRTRGCRAGRLQLCQLAVKALIFDHAVPARFRELGSSVVTRIAFSTPWVRAIAAGLQ